MPNLFADFVQLDVRLQKRLRGSGLGLSLGAQVRGTAGRKSGAVESELGKGSRFSVTLPMRIADPAPQVNS